MIIDSIPTLRQTKEQISAIGKTIGATSINVEIEPLARKITDLNRGMDILVQETGAANFPIVQQGYGTRSWISFLTLAAFVENQNAKIKSKEDDAEQHVILTMEEPEAHLHPQAQRQLFSQISKFPGQKIVSTHSPSVVAQSALADTIYFNKRDGKTSAIRYQTNAIDDKIVREVINTRAYIIFASAVVLCEGITEEIALPVYFQEHFKCAPYTLGVSFIGIGGQNYKTYLSIFKNFDIKWFIFSDGEDKAIASIKTAVEDVFGTDYSAFNNIIILENGYDYEKWLIFEGYGEKIIEAVCEYESDDKFFESYITQKNGQKGKGKLIRAYEGAEGRQQALIDFCHENKTKYAIAIAKKVVSHREKEKRIPSKAKSLFKELEKNLAIEAI
jgi:putative ATP-dependent endonuclease of OLD family